MRKNGNFGRTRKRENLTGYRYCAARTIVVAKVGLVGFDSLLRDFWLIRRNRQFSSDTSPLLFDFRCGWKKGIEGGSEWRRKSKRGWDAIHERASCVHSLRTWDVMSPQRARSTVHLFHRSVALVRARGPGMRLSNIVDSIFLNLFIFFFFFSLTIREVFRAKKPKNFPHHISK